MTFRKEEPAHTGFEQQLLKAENLIAKAISELFDLEDVLHNVCSQIKSQLDFDFVNISLVLLAQNTIESVYGVGIAENWANMARHYLEEDQDLRDIQADIVKRERQTEIIAGWDDRFDRWLYETFKHNQVNRVFTPILLLRDRSGRTLKDWFEHYDWDRNFTRQAVDISGQHKVINMKFSEEVVSVKVIGTIEAGYNNPDEEISLEKAVELAKIAAKQALDIRKTRLRYVLELISENAQKILQADLITLHFLLDSHTSSYVYQVRSGTINNLVPEVFPPRLNEQGIGWKAIRERCPKFISSNLENFNSTAYKEGSRSYAAFPLLIDRNKRKIIHQATAATIVSEDNSNYEIEPAVGVLYVHFKHEHEFTEDEIHRGKFIAERAVDAIWHAMTYQQVRDKARLLAALHSVTQSISQIPENGDLLSHIAWNTLNVLAADIVTIYAYFQTEEQFVTPPSIAGRLKAEQEMGAEIHEGEIPHVLIQRGETIYVSNTLEHEVFRNSPFVKREGVQSVAGVLLKVDEDVVGIMFINYRRRHSFSKEESQIIKTLASSAAAAIKNQQWLQTLNNIDHEIITTLEPDKLLDLIVERAVQITGADLGVLRSLEPISQDLITQAIYPANEPVDQDWTRIKLGEGIAGRVAQHRKSSLVENVQTNPHYISYFSRTLSEICVPLLGKDSDDLGVMGVLNVESRKKVFTQRDLQRLEVIADLAVIAIQNAESKKKLANMEMMATLGELTSQLLHRMKPDIGALKVLLREAMDGITRSNTDHAMHKANHMQRLVERLSRNLGRMKGWRQEEIEPIDLYHVISEALKQAQIQSRVKLLRNLPEDLPKVLGGEQQLIGIFDNLVQNAVDAMPNGGTLSICGVLVEREPQLWTKIIISDTGSGIAKENFEKIFQLGFTTKSNQGNMGFGLWWTQVQLEGLGGGLTISSEMDIGTQVAVILPAYKSEVLS